MNQPPTTSHQPPSLGPRSSARLGAVKALYSLLHPHKQRSTEQLTDDIIEITKEELGDKKFKPERAFMMELITEVSTHKEALIPHITPHLSKEWRFDRMPPLLQILVITAAYELLHQKDTPYKVVIDEYTSLANFFFDEKEVNFINGILEQIKP